VTANPGAISEAPIARARDLGVKLVIEDDMRDCPDGAPSTTGLTEVTATAQLGGRGLHA